MPFGWWDWLRSLLQQPEALSPYPKRLAMRPVPKLTRLDPTDPIPREPTTEDTAVIMQTFEVETTEPSIQIEAVVDEAPPGLLEALGTPSLPLETGPPPVRRKSKLGGIRRLSPTLYEVALPISRRELLYYEAESKGDRADVWEHLRFRLGLPSLPE